MLEIGSLVDDKYKVLNKIGQGGMSVVYLAMNEKANKQWAIKEVRKDGVKDFEVVKQGLIVETNLLKELRHSHLPAIVDVIETDGTFLIVMDYIEGKPLSDTLNERGALDQDLVIDWAKQLCDVLGYLHTRKPAIIYRDMKPANIMLKPDGNITLIDFGTARKYKENNIADTTCLGTLGYAAPEQFGGENQRQTDARTDIYCLGATLYHLVTGHNPCEPPYEMYPIRHWNAGLSEGLEKIILKCTQKNPEDRYQSCAELLYDLEHYDEIDAKHKRKQILKLATTTLTAVLTAVGVLLCVEGNNRIENKKVQDYSEVIMGAYTYSIPALVNGKDDPAVLKCYQDAIKIDKYNSTAYLKIIEYYSRLGNNYTLQGIEYVTSTIPSYEEKIKGIDDIYMEIGKLYFNGNYNDSEFNENYEISYQYFNKVNSDVYEEAKYYKALAMALSMNVAGDEAYEDFIEFEKYNDGLSEQSDDLEKKIENYLSLANLYFIQKTSKDLQERLEVSPLEKTLDIYGKALELINNPYAENDEKKIGEKYKKDIYFGIARSYDMLGKIEEDTENKKDYFFKAIDQYNMLLSLQDDISNEQKKTYNLKIIDIYIELNDYDKACEIYEELIEDYPQDTNLQDKYQEVLKSVNETETIEEILSPLN